MGSQCFQVTHRRWIKNLCQCSQINFTISQKKISRNVLSILHKLTCIKVSIKKVSVDIYSIYFHLVLTRCVIQLFQNFFLKDALLNLRQLFAFESLLKMMKNAFYFTLKAFFSFSRYLNFCLDFFVM